MRITARVENGPDAHSATVATEGDERAVALSPKAIGRGSAVNGGELLFLALATCYANDIHREAARRGIAVGLVEVSVEGEFGGPGDPARNVAYHARVEADATDAEIRDLMIRTDTVSEIQNTLRAATPVTLATVEAVSITG